MIIKDPFLSRRPSPASFAQYVFFNLKMSIPARRDIFPLLLGLSVLFLSSCASVSSVQPLVRQLSVSGRYDKALQVLEDQKAVYGSRNRLLYNLDRGMVLHLSGQYQESIDAFEKAKQQHEALYTESLSKIGSSWLWNDNLLPYRGEDYERVMINIFQALNFAAQGDFEAALVEARDVDVKLTAMNLLYAAEQKNVYREDAFARMLSGILYEASGTYADLNDAFISYEKAYQVYLSDYKVNYGLDPPRILKENLCTLARWMGGSTWEKYKDLLPQENCLSLQEKSQKGEIFFIQYHGYSPVKKAESVLLPMPGGYVSSFSFPKYQSLPYGPGDRVIRAENLQKDIFYAETYLGQDIDRIAKKNLADRKVRILVKGVARPVGRYFVERHVENETEKKHGKREAGWFRLLASLFNMAAEKADLRSWQTLPGEIRIARLILDPGAYVIYLNDKDVLAEVSLAAGEKKFIIFRTLK